MDEALADEALADEALADETTHLPARLVEAFHAWLGRYVGADVEALIWSNARLVGIRGCLSR
ncbi:hypothetical protein [Micromonospora mirobrigensis]|uniref:Uncharacterized protein n=1 Tax=Micromonospora mirobrigensis TaxID=262898 RepID=A0A1C4XI13_9ACTN|nr:hypothetical protein [Micromonospora mirobrigensis]SCF08054.1 hypothetical protein GA0070564_103106 [Micromonospora mirobrigensis]